MKKLKKKDKQQAHTTTSVYFDKLNKELQYRFQVKNVNYILNNGIINKGWLIANKDGISEAVLLLQKQKASVYILGSDASAIIGWDMVNNIIVGSLWKDKKKIDEIKSTDCKEIEKILEDWYLQARGEE